MKIEAISVDGLDLALAGWRFSRHDAAAADWREVYTIDVPVNELPSAVLLIRDATILEREVFTSMRNHVVWARTSHVDDPAAFVVPEELAVASNEANRARMVSERDAGLSQDEWRRHLPVTSLTAFAIRISFRDLVKLIGYLRVLAADLAIIDAVADVFADAAVELTEVGSTYFTGGDAALVAAAADAYQPVRFLHHGPIADPGAHVWGESSNTFAVGEFVVSRIEVPLWLRAQIVRHRPLAIVDTLYRDVLASPAVLDLTIEAPVRVEVAAARAYWRTVLSKRTCWLAQDSLAGRRDPWQVIIDGHGFDRDMLPCHDGRCPYAGDASLRVSGADPGCPCPRYCDISGVDKAPFRDRMIVAARSRHPFWLEEIDR
jgi:hypothetical protein